MKLRKRRGNVLVSAQMNVSKKGSNGKRRVFMPGRVQTLLSDEHNIPHAKNIPADTLVVLINRAK